MKNKKVEVKFCKKTDIDFGMLSDDYADGSFKVDNDFWIKYCDKRFEFETLHSDLIALVPKKLREKYFKEDLERSQEIQAKLRKKLEKEEK